MISDDQLTTRLRETFLVVARRTADSTESFASVRSIESAGWTATVDISDGSTATRTRRRADPARPRVRLAIAASLVLLIAAGIASVAMLSDRDTSTPQSRSPLANATTKSGSPGDSIDFPFVEDTDQITAQVVRGTLKERGTTVKIDKGTRHGVQPDMAVVSGAGLVGRVERASDSQSSVVLLRDSDSRVRVVLANGVTGFVVGRGQGRLLRLTDINGVVEVKKGDIVTTAGDPLSVFPGGIPVGRVQSAVNKTGALEQDILVNPSVDFRRLSVVKVLTTDARSTTNFVRPRELVRVAVINATGNLGVAVLKSNSFRGLGYQLLPPIENALPETRFTIACRAGFEEEAKRLEVDDRPVTANSAPPVVRPEIVPFEEPPRPGTEDADCVMIIGNAP